VEKLTGRRFVPRDLDNSQEAAASWPGSSMPVNSASPRRGRWVRLVQQSDPIRPIIEIGTLFGWSTLLICLFKDPGQKRITVDNHSWNPLGITPGGEAAWRFVWHAAI
jgi:predicted O-methyltransferase YrrM